MLDSDPKPDQNIVRFPDNIGQSSHSYVNPMSPRYSPRRTRFGCESQDSGTRTPPLWKTSPPLSPKRNHNHQFYESLSPNSRTREIAKGRMEMMEMVRNMPESCYELSLKDLVEKTTVADQENSDSNWFSEEKAPDNGETMSRSGSSKRVKKKNYDPARSGSNGNGGGFLLKMVFPVSSSLGSSPKQKKVSRHGNSSPARVSPRPSLDGSGKGLGMDWWKKKGSDDGEKKQDFEGDYDKSSRSSSRTRLGRKVGCWPLMRIKRSKSPE